MRTYLIKDLERITGIKAHTIRVWEKRYDIIEPSRTPTNIRYYTEADLKKLMNIATLNKNGFRISEIVEMGEEIISSKAQEILSKCSSPNSRVEELIKATIDLDNLSFEKLLSRYIFNWGFEKTLIEIIVPFLNKERMLWQTGVISSVNRHFFTNIVRRKVINAIDNVPNILSENSKKVLLFLPKDKHNEIFLLFVYYLLKKHGQEVIYLGQSVPFDDLVELVEIKEPNCLFLELTDGDVDSNKKYLEQLSNSFPKNMIFCMSQESDIKFSDSFNIDMIYDIKNILEIISRDQ